MSEPTARETIVNEQIELDELRIKLQRFTDRIDGLTLENNELYKAHDLIYEIIDAHKQSAHSPRISADFRYCLDLIRAILKNAEPTIPF